MNHFQCYEVKPGVFATPSVTAQDQFGTLSMRLRFPHRLCAPANKNNEGIGNPTVHLTGYDTNTSFTRNPNHTVVDQFGTLHLDVVRVDQLMVPSSKNGVPISGSPGDHFTCYKVRRSRGAPRFTAHTVSVVDQFETITETLIRPQLLCAPSSKNGEDPTAPSHPDHLLCYKTRSKPGFGSANVSIDNQFGTDQLTLIDRRELCVPALKDPGSSTTSSTTSTTSSSTTTTTIMGSPSGSFVEAR